MLEDDEKEQKKWGRTSRTVEENIFKNVQGGRGERRGIRRHRVLGDRRALLEIGSFSNVSRVLAVDGRNGSIGSESLKNYLKWYYYWRRAS